MKILFVPSSNGVQSHLIPLFVLQQRYFKRDLNLHCDFLLPKMFHSQFQDRGLNILPLDFSVSNIEIAKAAIFGYSKDVQSTYHKLRSKALRATSLAKYDIVVDDNEVLSTLFGEKRGIPRISIHRTGFFRSIEKKYRKPSHMHSMEKTRLGRSFDASIVLKPESNLTKLQTKYYRTTSWRKDIDYFVKYTACKTKLIPGIPSIEKLPDDINERESYFYTGPLLMEDNPSIDLRSELEAFFKTNWHRKKAFITTGLVEQDDIREKVLHLISRGFAVLSTRDYRAHVKADSSMFFFNPFLPLNMVCSNVDLIIHQCGSGIYHYPLIHRKPTITIGTQCYDREDVALVLEQLGLSRHVPSANDDDNHFEIFKHCIDTFEDGNLHDNAAAKTIQQEIYETMLGFDLDDVLSYTLSK